MLTTIVADWIHLVGHKTRAVKVQKKIRTRRMGAESLVGQEPITFSWQSARIED
ncbi:hypothetical protein SynMVIR181_01730 [Synechococcus sp. MVIR-18-1]|nr:hypothetical protein SynMVIR181_01730 [Synechococcus sp. MVIR-18-1]